MKLDKYLEVQRMVAELYDDDLVGVSEDYIHISVIRFLDEFGGVVDLYSWVDDPESDTNGEFHLYYYYGDMKFVAVFNDYDMDDLYQKVTNNELRADMLERFGDLDG